MTIDIEIDLSDQEFKDGVFELADLVEEQSYGDGVSPETEKLIKALQAVVFRL